MLENDSSVESLLIAWFSGYSRGSIDIVVKRKSLFTIHYLDNHIVENNSTLSIDTVQYCRRYICPESMNESQNLMCNLELKAAP